eukprot:scaffold80809_cov60-Phaeocystis_antarctica.AAC.2
MRRSESDAIERLAWVALALKRARTAADLSPCATLTLWLVVPGTASNLVRVGGRVRARANRPRVSRPELRVSRPRVRRPKVESPAIPVLALRV